MLRNNNEQANHLLSEKDELRKAFLTLMYKLPGDFPFGCNWKEGDEFLVLLSAIEYIRNLERLLGSQEQTEAY